MKIENSIFKMQLLKIVIGISIFFVCLLLPLEGIEKKGQLALGLTLMTVAFWALQVSHTGYIAGLYLVLLIILDVSDATTVLSTMTSSSTYLIIGAYLIAAAVKTSSLAQRIAYSFLLHFVKSYRTLIVAIFILTFVLSLFIPHAWPRAFLIMSVMSVVIKSADIEKKEAIVVGFAVFAASVPISLIFLTGASVTNPLALNYANYHLSWLGWLKVMGLPAILASVLTLILFLLIFTPKKPLHFNKAAIKESYDKLGDFSKHDKTLLIWLCIAILAWMLDFLHGIDIGWVTFLIAMLMSLPIFGSVIQAKHFKEVPISVLVFITAATAIGKVGAETGMNAYIAKTILPSFIPSNMYVLAIVVTTFTLVVHMFVGSVLSTMGVALPALLSYTTLVDVNPLVVVLWSYTVIASHFILPFHHMNVLVGEGEDNGLYSQKQTIKLGIPLIAVVYFITVVIETSWWKILKIL
ncbi:MAG: SLC13 family permease [Sphaerochaetaceae bacterium]|nr:SLC13 family permease [Sphaerochaetaceae bacterium]